MPERAEQQLVEVGRLFGLSLMGPSLDLPLAGSPERSVSRWVLAGVDGGVYVIEQLTLQQRTRKARIADLLDVLMAQGLPVNPYLTTRVGEHVIVYHDHCWQMAPFVGGEPLPRPDWVNETRRGAALAEFLRALRRARLPRWEPEASFSILTYIAELLSTLRFQNPQVLAQVEPLAEALRAELNPMHDTIPVSFCHGDLHPLNVIWGASSIGAVIDWEFCGPKPESYDLANLLGNVGVERPQALDGPFVLALLHGLGPDTLSPVAQVSLPLMVIAIRYAWLSEWLRKQDEDMIALEIDYLHLLWDQRRHLSDTWTRVLSQGA